MENNTELIIHSNINNEMMEQHFMRITADEAREREEREAKWKKEAEERDALDAEWKQQHRNLATYCYATRTNPNPYYSGGYCRIHFYEWSDIHSKPLRFFNYADLYRFLDDCKLFIESSDNSIIKTAIECHITCAYGKKDLIVRKTYSELEGALN